MLSKLKSIFRKPSFDDTMQLFGGKEQGIILPGGKSHDLTLLQGEHLVFSGVPATRMYGAPAGVVQRAIFSGQDADKIRVLITYREGKFRWKSRGGILLHHRLRGEFHYFVDSERGGFIKVGRVEGRVTYIEVFTASLLAFFYSGTGNELSMPSDYVQAQAIETVPEA